MLAALLQFFVGVAASLLGAVLLLRAWLYYSAISPRNPLCGLCRRLTDWLVDPLERLLPKRGGFDWPSLAGVFLTAVAAVFVHRAIGHLPATLVGLVVAPFAMILRWFLEMLSWGAIILAVLSWISPAHPMTYTLGTLLEPFMRSIRRIIPTTFRGIDFAPVVVVLAANALLILVAPLSRGFIIW